MLLPLHITSTYDKCIPPFPLLPEYPFALTVAGERDEKEFHFVHLFTANLNCCYSQTEYHAATADDPLDSITQYKRDFPGHRILPSIGRAGVQDVCQDRVLRCDAKMATETTSHEHYK